MSGWHFWAQTSGVSLLSLRGAQERIRSLEREPQNNPGLTAMPGAGATISGPTWCLHIDLLSDPIPTGWRGYRYNVRKSLCHPEILSDAWLTGDNASGIVSIWKLGRGSPDIQSHHLGSLLLSSWINWLRIVTKISCAECTFWSTSFLPLTTPSNNVGHICFKTKDH